jgi:hypothetical protein
VARSDDKMNSDSQTKTWREATTPLASYEQRRADLIRQIDEAETEMIKIYGERLQELLTDSEADIVCINIDLDEVETIRTRNCGKVYPNEDFRATHGLRFKIGTGEITLELAWTNWGKGRRPHGETRVTVKDTDTSLTYNHDGDWFMAPDQYSDRKKEVDEFFQGLASAFKDHTPSVVQCANLIIKRAPEMKW